MGAAWTKWIGVGLAIVWLGPASIARAEGCTPWEGEPAPLPTPGDPDPIRARWSTLRIGELSQRARIAEPTDRVESHRLWRRVLCLDLAHEAARAGVARTHPVRVHRPGVVFGVKPAETHASADVWAGLGRPIAMLDASPASEPAAAPRTPSAADVREAERRRRVARVERLLGEIDLRLDGARFEEALATAAEARGALADLGVGGDTATQRVRLEVLAATAEIALGDEAAARESFTRAMRADPALSLDPRTTSPKVLRVFDGVRDTQAAAP